MKKFIISLALILLTACAQTGNQNGMMQSGAMCEKCPCCQKMMDSGMMKDGMQCPMMKDGKPCSCCEKMMQNQSTKPVAKKAASKPVSVTDEDHKQHHPGQ